MRAEKLFWRLAIACALLLLLGIFPFWRTVWVGAAGYDRDSAGWDWAAALSGVVALTGLGIGAWARPRVLVPVLGAAAAAVAFAVAAYAAGSYWFAILDGTVRFDPRLTMRPSPALPIFAAVATVGVGCAVVLAASWSSTDDEPSGSTSGRIFSRIAMASAILLLLAPMTPRTSWSHEYGGMTHSAGWDWVAPLSGMAAIVALALGGRSRLRPLRSAVGAGIAALALAISAAASAGHWNDLRTGALDLDWESTTYPAPMVLPFAIIAAIGTLCSLALLGKQLRVVLAR